MAVVRRIGGKRVLVSYLLLLGWILSAVIAESSFLPMERDGGDTSGDEEDFLFRHLGYPNPLEDFQPNYDIPPPDTQLPFIPRVKKLGSELLGKRSVSPTELELDEIEKRRMGSEFLGKKRRLGSELLGKRGEPLDQGSRDVSSDEKIAGSPTANPTVSSGDARQKTLDAEHSQSQSDKGVLLEPKDKEEPMDNSNLQSFRPDITEEKRMGSEFLGKRRMGSEFLGKRRMGSEFLGKRRMGSEFLGKRRMGSEFLGKRMGSEFLGKRRMGSEFLGKRRMGSEFLGKRRMGSEFLGKRRMGSEFLGKRMGSEFLGKRRMGSEFLGKRMGSEFLGKRRMGSEFLGKRRMGSEFLGKRRMGSEFLGKRGDLEVRDGDVPEGDGFGAEK